MNADADAMPISKLQPMFDLEKENVLIFQIFN